ncbi:MAG: type III pantothenate kinase, partial [Usitatibacteraceae bacterium]
MTMRTLAIDAGNTRIKWGLYNGREWFLRGAVDIGDLAASHPFSDVLKPSEIDRVVISNVAGAAVARAIEDKLAVLSKPITYISAEAQQCGVVNRYSDPAQLGTDRWAALIAAHVLSKEVPRAQLVVMAGTALTVDALSEDGIFLGGIIVPGLRLMHLALNRGTAQLPAEHGEFQTFPRNTANAITTGAVEACAGAVQRMYTHLSAQVGEPPHGVGSGGAIEVIAP